MSIELSIVHFKKHRQHVCLDVRTVGELGEQLLAELQVPLQVRDHGERHEGDLARGLEEGGQVELLDQSEISMSPPITAHLVIRLAEGDGQRSVSGECLEDGRGVAQRGEQALGALPALVGEEGRVDLDKNN